MDITIDNDTFNVNNEPDPSIQRQIDTNKAANHTISQEVVDYKDKVNDIFEEDLGRATFKIKEPSKTGQVKKDDGNSLDTRVNYYEICKNYLN